MPVGKRRLRWLHPQYVRNLRVLENWLKVPRGGILSSRSAKRHEPFLIRTSWELDYSIDELRSILLEPLAITRWWAPVFLHAECIDEGEPDRRGYSMRCFTKGFLPHSFQFVARISDVREDGLVIDTHGDFDGIGTIQLARADRKTRVSVEWSVNVCQPYIRPFLKLLKPVFVWNHRWAMRQGHRGLERMLRARAEENRSFTPIEPTFPHNLTWFRTPQRWRI